MMLLGNERPRTRSSSPVLSGAPCTCASPRASSSSQRTDDILPHRSHATASGDAAASTACHFSMRAATLTDATIARERKKPAKRWRVSRAIESAYTRIYERTIKSLQKIFMKFGQVFGANAGSAAPRNSD